MANVTLTQLTKLYPEKSGSTVTAVKAIDLEITAGEFMVLVGPSGCGKSTTLRMIAGLEEVSGGGIAIEGRDVSNIPPKDRDIAMVFQNYALYPHMSVYDNMAFGLKLRRFPKAEIDRRVREAAAMLGLEPYLERKPKALSGGQRQRVAVGRAIVRKPKVFLFDEPLSNLDAKMRVTTRTEISKLHARLGATMIYVTHDQVEAMTMGDRICVMKDGRIMQVAEPLTLYRRPENMFVAGFIGSPPMNFFSGRIERTGDRLVFAEANDHHRAVVPLEKTVGATARNHVGKSVVFGIRPENIRLTPTAEEGGSGPITATVELAEPMGAETYLYLTTGATAFIARVHSSERHAAGQPVALEIDVAHAHLFDPATEDVLKV